MREDKIGKESRSEGTETMDGDQRTANPVQEGSAESVSLQDDHAEGPSSALNEISETPNQSDLDLQYKLNLLAVTLFRAQKVNLKFYLMSDRNSIGAFGSMILKLLNDDGTHKSTAFLHAKHFGVNDNRRLITIDDLLPTEAQSNNWSLHKYLQSYLLIRSKFLDQTTVFYRGKFDECQFVIYTNGELDPGLEDIDGWSLINFDEDKKAVKLNPDEGIVQALAEALVKTLAEEIYNYTWGSKTGKSEIFEIHRLTLASQVFDVELKKFREKLPGDLWTKLLEAYQEEHAEELSDSEFNDKLKEADGQLEFCGMFQDLPHEQGPSELSLANCREAAKKFLGQLQFIVRQPNHDELVAKLECEIRHFLSGTNYALPVCEEFTRLVIDWSEHGVTILTQENSFFREAILTTITKSHIKRIDSYDIRFTKGAVAELASYITDTKFTSFLHIATITQAPPLSLIKLRQVMDVLQARNWATFLLRPNDIPSNFNWKKSLSFRKAPTLLAFEVDSLNHYETFQKDLKRSLCRTHGVKVVFIFCSPQMIDHHCFDTFRYADLTKNSQKKLCDQEITLQGQPIKLSTLIDVNRCDDIFTSEAVKELINSKGDLTVGKLLRLSDSDEAYVKVSTDLCPERLVKCMSEWTDEDALFVVHGVGNQSLMDRLKCACGSRAAHLFISWDEQKIGERFMQQCRENPGKPAYLVKITDTRVHLCEIYNPTFYRPRKFVCRNVVLNAEVISKNINTKHKLILYGPHIKNESYGTQVIKAESKSNAKYHLQSLCDHISEDATIHVLKSRGQKLIWKWSRGPLKIITDHIDSVCSSDKLVEESQFHDMISDKVAIIADNPGTGTSTTLTSLSEQMVGKYWVTRIDLRLCGRAFRYLPANSEITLTHVVQFLLGVTDIGLNSELSKSLLQHKLRNETPGKPLLLLFDGFEKIDAKSQERTIKLVEFLKSKTPAYICITTGQKFKNKLEDSFSKFAIELDAFDLNLQEDFLYNFWNISLRLTGDADNFDQRLREFSKNFIKRVHDAGGLLGTPLQLRMLAEVYQTDVTSYLNGNQDVSIADLGLAQMYEKSILAKYKSYFQQRKKNCPGDAVNYRPPQFKNYDNEHIILALCALFPETCLLAGLSIQRVTDELKSIGIIQPTGMGEEFHFIHGCFAEFFIAKFLASNLKESYAESVWFILSDQCLRESHSAIRKLLNLMLAKDSIVHNAVLQNDLGKVTRTLTNAEGIRKDTWGRTALHVAAEMGNRDIVMALIQNGYKATEYDFLGRSPLHYAAICQHGCVVKCLLDCTADVGMHDNIFSKPLRSNADVEDCIFKKEHLNSDLVKLVNAKDVHGKSALIYCCEMECSDIACTLLLYGARTSHVPENSVQPLFSWAKVMLYEVASLLFLKFASVIAPTIYDREMLYKKSFLKFCFTGYHTLILETLSQLTDYKWYCHHWPFRAILSENSVHENDWKVLVDLGKLATISNLLLTHASCNDSLLFWPANFEEWDTSTQTPNGDTALHVAAFHGNLTIMKYLIKDKKVNVNILSKTKKRTPVFYAALNEQFEAVQYLGENGAKFHIPEEKGRTALDIIATFLTGNLSESMLKICKYLAHGTQIPASNVSGLVLQEIMLAGNDVNKPGCDGVYLLHKAAECTSEPFVRYLIDQGADVNVRDRRGESALHYAARNRVGLDIVDFLLGEGTAYNEQLIPQVWGLVHDPNGRSGYSFWCKGAKGNVICEPGRRRACITQCEKAEEIFNNVPRISVQRPYFNTSKLFYQHSHPTFQLGNKRLTVPLYIFGIKDCEQNTLLHLAVSSGNTDVCESILSRKYWEPTHEIYARKKWLKNASGNTPLHISAEKGFLEITGMLLDYGYMTNEPNNENKTPRDLAQKHTDIIELFNSIDSLYNAIVEDDLQMVTDRIWRSNYETVRDGDGQTLLHVAAKLGRSEIVQWLVMKFACLSSETDNDGSLPIHLAAKFNSLSEVKTLYDHETMNFGNHDGNTPLHFAAQSDSLDIVVYLLQKKTIFNPLNQKGETPFELAGQNTKSAALLNRIGTFFVKFPSQNGPTVEDFEILRRENYGNFLAALHAFNNNGKTLLHLAAESDNLALVMYLLQSGVPYNIKSNSNEPEYYASYGNVLSLFQCIDELFHSELPSCVHRLRGILQDFDAQSFLNICNDKGENIIFSTNFSRCKIKYFISCGADINGKDNFGRTWLECAAVKRDWHFFKFMCNQGADIQKLPLKVKNQILEMAKGDGRFDIARDLSAASVKTNL